MWKTIQLKVSSFQHGSRQKVKESFNASIHEKVKQAAVENFEFSPSVVYPPHPPWMLLVPDADITLLEKIKNYKGDSGQMAMRYVDNYYGYVQIFTDGSKQPDTGKVAIAYVIPEFYIKFSARVSDHLSVYTAELIAIVMALQWVEQIKPLRVVVCSDSLSALEIFKSGNSSERYDIVCEILTLLHSIQNGGKHCKVCLGSGSCRYGW